MIYTIRVNPKNYNPITRKPDPRKYWEVQQQEIKGGTGHDSESVIWHFAAVRVGGVDVQVLFDLTNKKPDAPSTLEYRGVTFCKESAPSPVQVLFERARVMPKKQTELTFQGVCLIAGDNALEITERTANYEVR